MRVKLLQNVLETISDFVYKVLKLSQIDAKS